MVTPKTTTHPCRLEEDDGLAHVRREDAVQVLADRLQHAAEGSTLLYIVSHTTPHTNLHIIR
jgi:hypothetical protein